MIDIRDFSNQVSKLADWYACRDRSMRNDQRRIEFYNTYQPTDVYNKSRLINLGRGLKNWFRHEYRMIKTAAMNAPDPVFSIAGKRLAYDKMDEINYMLNPDGFKKSGYFYLVADFGNTPRFLLGILQEEPKNMVGCPEYIIDKEIISTIPIELTAIHFSDSLIENKSKNSFIIARQKPSEIALCNFIEYQRSEIKDLNDDIFDKFDSFGIDVRGKLDKNKIKEAVKYMIENLSLPHERGHYAVDKRIISDRAIKDIVDSNKDKKIKIECELISDLGEHWTDYLIYDCDEILYPIRDVLADIADQGTYSSLLDMDQNKRTISILYFIYRRVGEHDIMKFMPELYKAVAIFGVKNEKELLIEGLDVIKNRYSQYIGAMLTRCKKGAPITTDEICKIYNHNEKIGDIIDKDDNFERVRSDIFSFDECSA